MVPTTIEASVLSLISPVRIPTLFFPKNFENPAWIEFVSAFKGVAYQTLPFCSTICCATLRAIQVLPAPVGAVTRQSEVCTAFTALS